MKCPFCGSEMERGGVYLPTGRGLMDTSYWVPALEAGFPGWSDERSVPLQGSLKEAEDARPLAQQLFSSFPQAQGWLCPACGKVVAVFDRVQEWDPLPHVPDGPLPSVWDILHPEGADKPPEEAPSSPKPRRGKEPWEKKGLFRRKKDKPDWEL